MTNNFNLQIFDVDKLVKYINSNLRSDSESVYLGLETIVDNSDKVNLDKLGDHVLYTKTIPLIRKVYDAHIKDERLGDSSEKIIGKLYAEAGVLTEDKWVVHRQLKNRFFREHSPYEMLMIETDESILLKDKKVLPVSSILVTLPNSYDLRLLNRSDVKECLFGLTRRHTDLHDVIPTKTFIRDDYSGNIVPYDTRQAIVDLIKHSAAMSNKRC